MKNFKKILMLTVLFSVTLLFAGCGGAEETGGTKNIEGKLEDLMAKVYKDLPEDHTPMYLENHVVNEENIEYYLGTKDIEYKEALASESGVGSTAHSVVLVRVKENADIEKTKEAIRQNIDPRKWICVGVEIEDVIIKNRGDLIIVIIEEDEESRKILDKGFDNL